MRKRFLLGAMILFILCGLTGCGEPYEELEGVVEKKEIREEEIKEETIDESLEKKNYEVTYPKSYILYVRYYLGSGKEKLYQFFVSENIYRSTKVGDSYLYDSYKDQIEPSTVKKELKDQEEKE